MANFVSAKFKAADDPAAQLAELVRLEEVLEKGSSSLNQRATTLAALAVAALGAFGVFAGRIGELDASHDVKRLVAIGLVVASVSLFLAAVLALLAAAPTDGWSRNFARANRPIVRGNLDERGERLTATVQRQLSRNHKKKNLMGWAYGASTLALVATTFAVIVVAVNAPG